MKRTTIGLDIAKQVFELYVEEGCGQRVDRKRLSRKKLLPWFANRPPALVGLEACGGAHYWARELTQLGHNVRLIAPQYVKPWVQTNKSDRADARAICRAVQEPGMRFVSVATEAQQEVQALHRVARRLRRHRVALVNQLHGLLLEFGVAVPRGRAALRRALLTFHAEEGGTPLLRQIVAEQQAELAAVEARLEGIKTRIQQASTQQPVCQQLQTIPGIGPLSASALWVKLAGHGYQHGRHLAAALGLVPKHEGTGGKIRLGGMSKRGDRYLRSLLIHGARAVVSHSRKKQDSVSRWICRLVERRGMNKAVVALANKNARVAFAVFSQNQMYVAPKACCLS